MVFSKIGIIPLMLILLLLTTIAFCLACDNNNSSEVDLVLPVYEKGDSWTYRHLNDDIETIVTELIIGEDMIDGEDCYVLKTSCVPPLYGIDTIVTKVSKTTMQPLTMQTSGKYDGIPFESTNRYTYERECFVYPYEVGKACDVIKTVEFTVSTQDEVEEGTEKQITTYSVESEEQISVIAGTFKCFKIVEYGDTGVPLRTVWLSEQVGFFQVKSIDHMTGGYKELISSSFVD